MLHFSLREVSAHITVRKDCQNVKFTDLMFARGSSAVAEDACGLGSTSTHQGGLNADALGSLEGQGQILDLKENKRWAEEGPWSAATHVVPPKHKAAATAETRRNKPLLVCEDPSAPCRRLCLLAKC